MIPLDRLLAGLLAAGLCGAPAAAAVQTTDGPFSPLVALSQDPNLTLVPPGVTVVPVLDGDELLIGKGQPPSTWKIFLSDPAGTGFDETFLLKVPPASAFPAPLLVAFHAYGVSQDDIDVNTTFEEECEQRGWFLVAPLGASQVSFSCQQSQIHTELVLDLVSSLWPTGVDPARIYGAGFSMGGGNALNYAARHLDPAHAMFAAVANHTGGVALLDSYANQPAVHWVFEFWFGGPPAAQLFEYQRASVLNFDEASAVDLDSDLARNLTHVPVRSIYTSFDPNKYLIDQTKILHSHLQFRGGTSLLLVKTGFGHSWNTLNEAQTCDWFEQYSLQLPLSGETLADHDGAYFHFFVRQDAPLAFTPFTWAGDPALNQLTLSATANLERIEVRTASLGLDPAAPLTVVLSTSDGLADEVLLDGYSQAPASVLRDGLRAAWTWNRSTGTLLLAETDGGATHSWVVTP
ncbi:MAG: hypothetical protein AAF682_00930 [Planctomycetota bacterium]